MADYGTAGNRGPETAAGARHATGVRNVATSKGMAARFKSCRRIGRRFGVADRDHGRCGERAPNGRCHGRTGSLTSENQSLFRYLARPQVVFFWEIT